MKRIQHEEHLDEAHDTHSLCSSRSVQLLTEVEAAAILMAKVGTEEVGICIKFRSEIFQEVRFCSLKVVGLDSVDCLGVATERNHVVDLA